jgi:ketosteroid isomerase-like protein
LLAALRTDAPDSLLALLTDDVVIMPPNEAILRGKPTVRTWYEQFVGQMRTKSLELSNRELVITGDQATEVSQFVWTLTPIAGGEPVVDRGSYMQIWRRQPDGRWLFSRELWNSTGAPAGGD